jgi:hypothetical protein
MLKSLPSKSLYSVWDEAGWEGEPEIGRARRPAVFPEASTLEVKESWVQALSLQKDSRLFYLWHHLICGGRRQFRSGRASYLSFRSPYCGSWVFTSELVEMEVEDEGKNRD